VHRPMARFFGLTAWLGAFVISVMLATTARAQTQPTLGDGYFNSLGGPRVNITDGATIPGDGDPRLKAFQLQGRGATSIGGFASPFSNTIDVSIPGFSPRSVVDGVTTFELREAILGVPLAVKPVSYNFGDVITPPDYFDHRGLLIADYYKSKPANAGPEGLFYYSESADKVFATQAGGIEVVWEPKLYGLPHQTEYYQISNSPSKPERTIFWTEGNFNGPVVRIPDSRVRAVNFVFNSLVPETVKNPFVAPWPEGLVDATAEKKDYRYKTIYRDLQGNIRAYNVEGRVFVEYVGAKAHKNSPPVHLGFEIVNIERAVVPKTMRVDLGEKLSHPGLKDREGNDVQLEGQIVAGQRRAGHPEFIYAHAFHAGTKHDFFAVRETRGGLIENGEFRQIGNEALMYWRERGVLNLLWPKQYVGYVFAWPKLPENWQNLSSADARYSVYARPDSTQPGGVERTAATGVALEPANHPHLQYQDHPLEPQARINTSTSIFNVTLRADDPTNRALIRYSKGEEIWFERVFSQLDPYDWDPAPLTHFEVTGAPDVQNRVATGHANISDVIVTDTKTNAVLILDTDYTVDGETGVIQMIDKRFVTSKYKLGDMPASAYIGLSFWSYTDTSTSTDGPDWEIHKIELSIDGLPTPGWSKIDFSNTKGNNFWAAGGAGQTALNTQDPGPKAGWIYQDGAWVVGGSEVVSSATLAFGKIYMPGAGDVTLTVTHRFDYEGSDCDSGDGTIYDAGVIDILQFLSDDFGNYARTQLLSDGMPYNAAFSGESPHRPLARVFSCKGGDRDFVMPEGVKVTFRIPPQTPFASAPVAASADIARRIEPGALRADTYGDKKPVHVGYIDQRAGNAFNGGAYGDPFVVGFKEAATKAIIPVNNLQGNSDLKLWWFRLSTPPKSTGLKGTYWPSFPQKYELHWPEQPDVIDLASNRGSGDLPSLQTTATIYTQNTPGPAGKPAIGFNPNEEHALMINGRAWALRDDLNITATSSQPYVLLNYTEADGRPAMRAFKVKRGTFEYNVVAGTPLQSPAPLSLMMAKPFLSDGKLASYEVAGTPDRAVSRNYTRDAVFQTYQKFTWTDRKGGVWVYRGPHDGNKAVAPPSFIMRYFYLTLPGFYFPSKGDAQPPVGTTTPFLRPKVNEVYLGDPVTGERDDVEGRKQVPLDVTFIPTWPEHAPQLRLGETLTLPKLGLPAVRGQSSAQLIYQQSMTAREDFSKPMFSRKASAVLFDPTRAKTYALGGKDQLAKIPESVNTDRFLGKVYFPNLPPHLSGRLFFDPTIGADGSLVLVGQFKDEPVGEKYLLLNVLTAKDMRDTINLVPKDDVDYDKWAAAINGLSTVMETFIENPAKRGTYIPLQANNANHRAKIVIDGTSNAVPAAARPWAITQASGASDGETQRVRVGPQDLAQVHFSDTAVDSYAISATGGGSGFVVMAVGNGINTATTPKGDPVSLQVFQVEKPLYSGELKVIASANPLDEKLTLQHTGDFAGKPEDYDFEWRVAQPVGGKPPQLYSFARTVLVGEPRIDWRLLNNPVTSPAAHDYRRYRNPAVTFGEAIADIKVNSKGQDYTDAVKVVVDGGGGQGVRAQAHISAGKLHDISVLDGGFGFTKVPDTVRIEDAGGSRASASVTLTNSRISGTGQIVARDGNAKTDRDPGLPQALLRRVFTATQRPIRLFLSLELGAQESAEIYINGAQVVTWNISGKENSETASPPATVPAFETLPMFFEIDPSAVSLSDVVDGAQGNNVITVDLYSASDVGAFTTFNLRLEGLEQVQDLSTWLPLGKGKEETISTASKLDNAVTPHMEGIAAIAGKNRHTIEGSTILTLSDNYLIMRYRARENSNAAFVSDAGWSHWTEPQLAEGWIKRVLAGINPFQQRIKDFFNNEINTSVSLVQQAGRRWEGDIALNLDSVNESGLIEIYETVLRRGRKLSIDGAPAIDNGGANDALLLAAGYLSDLYMILGNEAFADAENPTIAFDTTSAANFVTQYGDVATSLFAFKGQLATTLEEELALLRGRDDFLLPGARKTPVYNRLIWNYTRGIDSGEAVYALNYDIKDVAWDMSINPNNLANQSFDGIISAADAAGAYPQGHGDAYGHYLTALTGYYGLLSNDHFTWTPRIEAVQVLGTPVAVDYQDERKFAAAAAAWSRTTSRIVDLTYRQEYVAKDDAGWDALNDGKQNTETGEIRGFGTDDWAPRGGQGALFHWATGNSMLPPIDPNPSHSGIQKIDRTTVPELGEIVANARTIQATLDNADAQMNPLGLEAHTLTFDISAAEVSAGKTHFEQIYERAILALGNAETAFHNANGSTQFLRQQDGTLADRRHAIKASEQAFDNRLIELYGSPYADDIGPGRSYAQGYEGPDLLNHLKVDVTELIGSFAAPNGLPVTKDGPEFFKIYRAIDKGKIDGNGDFSIDPKLKAAAAISDLRKYVLTGIDDTFRKPDTWTGRRRSPGRMQTAVSNTLLARQELYHALVAYDFMSKGITSQSKKYKAAVDLHEANRDLTIGANTAALATNLSLNALSLASQVASTADSIEKSFIDAATAAFPTVNGFSNDVTSGGRAVLLTEYAASKIASKAVDNAASIAAFAAKTAADVSARAISMSQADANWAAEQTKLIAALRGSLSAYYGKQANLDAALRRHDQAQRDMQTLMASGDRIQKERLVFRERSASVIQGYRTHDFAFRAFRDEALERYDVLFDLAARYTFLAALAYDYETGLLNTAHPSGAASRYFEDIVKARALGVIHEGRPQFAGSEGGDPGLSGVLARLGGDWDVVKNRLGFNNPDRDLTTFSLRWEAFRIAQGEDSNEAWKTKLLATHSDNILDDPDVRRHALQLGQPNTKLPGLIIEFPTQIEMGLNFFGQTLGAGDHQFSPSAFATKIHAAGIGLEGYDAALSATPYVFLIPVGADKMRAPALGGRYETRSWQVQDQAVPLPFNIAQSPHSSRAVWVSAASLSEPAFNLRKHPAFRALTDGTYFNEDPSFTNNRLVGRSAWNTGWKLVIPGITLLGDADDGLDKFISSVSDIKLHLNTYSHSGN
jgi:hypothetical protein